MIFSARFLGATIAIVVVAGVAGVHGEGFWRGIQAQTVLDEKSSRSAAQKKIDSQLLYALKKKRGETRGVPTETINIELDQKGRALVDITAKISPQVSDQIRKLGGIVISEEAQYHTMRARLALEKLEALAGRKDVNFIAPAAQSMNNRVNTQVRPN